MNKVKIEANGIKVDASVQGDATVVSLLQLVIGGEPVVLDQYVLDAPVKEKTFTQEAFNESLKVMADIPKDIPKEIPKIAKPPKKALNTSEEKSSLYRQGEPPIWVIECDGDSDGEGCHDFVTLNINKHGKDTFSCSKCNTITHLSREDVAPAKYTCECGTNHSVMIHSVSKFVYVKCRECDAPIDLIWNEKKKEYVMCSKDN